MIATMLWKDLTVNIKLTNAGITHRAENTCSAINMAERNENIPG